MVGKYVFYYTKKTYFVSDAGFLNGKQIKLSDYELNIPTWITSDVFQCKKNGGYQMLPFNSLNGCIHHEKTERKYYKVS